VPRLKDEVCPRPIFAKVKPEFGFLPFFRFSPMRTNHLRRPFFNLPFLLVLGMGSCVLLTGLVSYKLGDAALQGVTQPATNPTQKLISKSSEAIEEQPTVKFTPVNIAQTAKETRQYIQKQQKATSKNNKAATSPEKKDSKSEADPTKKP
jgi:hypothetical protein